MVSRDTVENYAISILNLDVNWKNQARGYKPRGAQCVQGRSVNRDIYQLKASQAETPLQKLPECSQGMELFFSSFPTFGHSRYNFVLKKCVEYVA